MSALDLERLMNQEIDGRNSAAESAALQQALRQDPDARRKFTELSCVATALSSMGMLEPPAGLAESILSALPPRRQIPVPTRPLAWLSPAHWPGGLALRFAMVFAAGIGLGILGSAVLKDLATREAPGMSGMLAPVGPGEGRGEPAAVPFSLEGDTAAGMLRVWREAGGILVTVETPGAAARKAHLRMVFHGGALQAWSAEQGHAGEIAVSDGEVRWSQDAASRTRWSIVAGPSDSRALEFGLSVEGREIYRTNFLFPPVY